MATLSAQVTTPMRWPLLALLRPKQWVKNALIFAPMIFTGSFTRPEAVSHAIVAALLFCAASSASYIFNDLSDLEADRLHPQKSRTRPLAAGRVSIKSAWLLLGLLYAIVLLSFFFQPHLAVALVSYIVLNLAYSARLKSIPVVDLFIIASGFVLRVYAGALSLLVPLSFWMFITTLCGALYLAAIKRRQELHNNGPGARIVLQQYTVPLLDYYAQIAAISAILFYGLFVATVRPALSITIPLVLFGLFRYRFLVEMKNKGESPTEVIWSDKQLVLVVLVWSALSVYVMWPN